VKKIFKTHRPDLR